MSGRTVYLTGGTGFIGNRLARRIAARGDRLRCLVRGSSRANHLRELGAELVVADVADAAAHEEGMRGCSMAYHLAAIYDLGVVDRDALERANVEGTRSFLRALERSAVERAVYVSSTAALGPSENGISDRVTEYSGPYPSVYHRTKAVAHGLARAAQSRGAPLIIACPAFAYGPEDEGPPGRFIRDLLRGSVPGLLADPAWFSFVYVDDVAEGLLRVGDAGRLGGIYVLSGEPASMNDFAARVAQLAGQKLPWLRFPTVLAATTGRVLDLVSRVTGLRFAITHENVATTAGARWLHSHEAATRELDWHPRTLEQGLPETVAWFLRQQRSL